MGGCCGKEVVVATVEPKEKEKDIFLRGNIAEPAAPPPVAAAPLPPPQPKYTGPPPEFFIRGLAAIEDDASQTASDLFATEVQARRRLVDWLGQSVAAQDRIDIARKAKEAALATIEQRKETLFDDEVAKRNQLIQSCSTDNHALLLAFQKCIQEQQLKEVMQVDTDALIGNGYALVDMEPLTNFGDMFGQLRVLDDDEISARSTHSRRSTMSAMDWSEALRSKTAGFSPANSQRSQSQAYPARSALLDRQPFLKLEIDEVGARDDVERDGLKGLTTMRIEAFEYYAIANRRRFLYPNLLEAHFTFVIAVCEHVECYHRADLEHQWLREAFAHFKSLFTKVSKKKQWDEEKAKMDDRRSRKAAAQKAARDDERRSDKLRWEIERMRLNELKGISASDKLRMELEQARQIAAPHVAASPGRATRTNIRQLTALGLEEERHREAAIKEQDTRWSSLWNSCASECPWIVNHPQRAAYIARKEAEVAKWKLLSNSIVAREEDARRYFAGVVDDRSLRATQRNHKSRRQRFLSPNSRLKGFIASLTYDEEAAREECQFEEKVMRERLEAAIEDELDVLQIHHKRRRIKEWADGREGRLASQEAAALYLLQIVGKGLIWRRRLGVVVPRKEEVRALIMTQAREHKSLVQQEHIDRGDLFHCLVQDARLSAIKASKQSADGEASIDAYLRQMFPKTDAKYFPWDPTVLVPVEQLAREGLWRAFQRSMDSALVLPELLERQAIQRLPQHLIGARLRAVTTIQRAFRSYKLRSEFNKTRRDDMVLAKLMRVRRKSELRLLREQEREARYAIEDQYYALGYHKLSTREEWFAQWTKEGIAASKIQGLARGNKERSKLDPRMLVYLKNKLHSLTDRRASRDTLE